MKIIPRYFLFLIILISCVGHCFAQDTKRSSSEIITDRPSPENYPESWKEFSSKEGRFTILFPGVPEPFSNTLDTPYGRIVERSFMLKTFSYYGVAYSDFPEKDGIRDVKAFFAGFREGNLRTTHAQLLEEKDDYRFANPGRFIKTRIQGGYVNRIRLYLIRNRLYVLSIVIPEDEATDAAVLKSHEEIAAKFFNSFKPKIDENSVKGGINLAPIGVKPLNLPAGVITGDPVLADKPKSEPFANVAGGILNGKAISLPKPVYPAEARAAGASGEVTVKIVFDESGNVIWAKAVKGHNLLQAVSEEAASKAKFQPIVIQGKPVKVSGFLVYKFVK